ncbi:hypothetical protein [Bernardetia sp.]|uniref:hypothetical protein n=1 Tax=Bernardetia sp. TaxID=1937974 RepID=UPI0025C6A951|nr:hypothetical protein [Bernardetia sp.]
MTLIKKKKIIYPVSEPLRKFLIEYKKEIDIPVSYSDLKRYNSSINLYDKRGDDTLWLTVFYAAEDMREIYDGLKKIYAMLKADGDLSVMEHLYIDRVDLCSYGNTQPFRVRIVNQINDNFDYFYIKQADASRVYGLELEDMISPNRINYLVHEQTLIEEHIAGIPGYQFINDHLNAPELNKIRLAKEFVKFNERCFVRLLGDMHSNNFVIDITPDFEEVHYRIRAIDFDQQSFEGRRVVYMPQYFKENNPIIKLGIDMMTPETVQQYQKEERSLMAQRVKASLRSVKDLLKAMRKEPIAPKSNVVSLREELASFYKDDRFLKARNMGSILQASLEMLF